MSQYIADVLALYVGLPEHVRELNQLPIAATRKLDGLRGDSRDNRIMTRPHREVSERLARQAPLAGSRRGHVAPYIADILAVHVGLPEYARATNCVEEGLPLAM